jgi:hypothetical protein
LRALGLAVLLSCAPAAGAQEPPEAGLAPVEGYEYEWHRFSNSDGTLTPRGGLLQTARPVVAKAWSKKVEIFLRREGGWSVVGIDRES